MKEYVKQGIGITIGYLVVQLTGMIVLSILSAIFFATAA